ncbi:wax ester/triacylglycerol synthase family O-acyltransferase [Algiphilus sp.]|uniref:WS/DGAT/MGAT family O-acyltransferase n=1 Tax=Algiphilus sp. TaxID=1872431 RepID=UPI0032F043A0
MAGKRLNALDWTFLANETRESMMHVGSMMTCSAAPGGTPEDLSALMEEIRNEVRVYPPWNLKLRFPNVPAHPLQRWVEDENFDIDYHVRHSALPAPGDERKLGVLVSRLHSHSMDFHRPPWEVHLIEGLEGGRFAMYFKVHHSLIDGYTGIQLLSRSLSRSPDDRSSPMFFARAPGTRVRAEGGAPPPVLESLMRIAREQLGTTRSISKSLFRSYQRDHTELAAPMRAPKSIINQRVSRNRRFATQEFTLDRFKRVGEHFGGTINDVVLAVSSASLRRLLQEQNALPAETMTAMLPVNIRPKDDPGGGNAVGTILASLATDIDDPVARFEAIIASTTSAKAQLKGMTRAGIMQYSALLMAPLLLAQVPGAVGRVRPAFNLVVSNVPGPREPLYFRGWKLDAYYPMSIPFHGYGLNVTVVSYVDKLDFGFTGCRDSVPHLQRMAVYSAEALEELEAAI